MKTTIEELRTICNQADALVNQAQLSISLPNGETVMVRLENKEARLAAMHAFSRAGIKAGFLTFDGFCSNVNTNGNFWGSKL